MLALPAGPPGDPARRRVWQWAYLVGLAPDRGAALELRGPGGDVLGGEGQVVVGGLHRQRGPCRPGLSNQSQRLGRGQVNDVTPDPGGSEVGDVRDTGIQT